MAINQLTDRQIRLAKPEAKEYLLADGAGLFLRVRSTNTKDWMFVYTFGGKRRKIGLGSLDAVSLSGARQQAEKLREAVATGVDPQIQRQQEEAKQDALRKAIETAAARMTVTQLFERWERLDLKARKDKGAEVRRSFEKDVLPVIGTVAADEIKRSMIAGCLDTVVERGAPVIARNLLGDLRQMFGFAIKRDYVENDPTSHLKRDDFGKKVERERVLTADEIKLLVSKLPNADLQEASIAAVWIMLSTCCRVSEVSQARWEHIDLQAGTWWLPPGNTKNAKEHTIYLSEFAVSHFKTLLRLAEDGNQIAEVNPWVLPASHKDGHVCLKSLTKQIGDRQRGDKEPMKNRSKLTNALELPRGKWTPHDLRRTGATMMGTLGVRPDVIEKCLNHVEQNRLVRIYQRQTLQAEQLQAWRLLGERLELLSSKTGNNVHTADFGKVAA